MRAFIAIELPKDIKETLAGLQNQFKIPGFNAKWVEPKNIHLTLKFLGDINEETLKKTTEIIEDIAGNQTSFKIQLFSLGVFPGIDFPRIIWVGISKGDQEVKTIAKELEDKIKNIGIPKEDRAFSSHITIARVKSLINKNKLALVLSNLNEKVFLGEEFEISKITLFKSTLGPLGPTYETQKEANFKAI